MGPGLLGDGLLLAIGFPHNLEKGLHCLHRPANGCPADEPRGGARRICWVKMDMLGVDKGHGVEAGTELPGTPPMYRRSSGRAGGKGCRPAV